MEPCHKLNFYHDEDIDTIVYNIRKEYGLFTMSTEQLAKTFLNKALCIDCFTQPFNVVRDTFIRDANKEGKEKDDVPNDLNGFYAYILQRYFRLWQEPKTVLLEYYTKATKDWNEVDDRIAKINEDIEMYKNCNNPTEKQEHLPILNFYLEHTENAKEDILKFLKKEKEEFILYKCSMPVFANRHITPYTYYLHPYIYDIVYPTMISNKFHSVSIERRDEIQDMYEKRPNEFKSYLRDYIIEGQIIDGVRIECEKNYFFNKQQSFINEALAIYESGSTIVFSSACFLIVEGLLHDICLQLGVPEVDILGAGFQIKLDKIYHILKTDINYPYYSFKFRLLRNKVVHGTANSDELKEIADLLFLDLVDMLKVTKSKKILMNAKIFCLNHTLQDHEGEKKYMYLLGYLALDDVVLPASFFDIREAHEKVIELLKTDEFWNFLDSLLNSRFDEYIENGTHLLRKIKNLRIDELNEKCKQRFRVHGNIKANFDRESFLNMIFYMI